MSEKRHYARVGLVIAAMFLLAGCAGVVLGGAATTGVAVAQERTVGAAMDDAGIRFRVKDQLLDKSGDLFRNVAVESVEGRVLLTGIVATPEERLEVARITWQINGVREVFNELQVTNRGGIGNYLTDARIATQLRFKLMTDGDISSINYTIETINKIVYLIGIAQSQQELERVTGHARTISGVSQVVSYVILKDDKRRL
ncbi:MAG: BON domain-containing protein [Proteobacteria bacterium]|nr:BON domain-containing protein [Pseudomonadota bacterium]